MAIAFNELAKNITIYRVRNRNCPPAVVEGDSSGSPPCILYQSFGNLSFIKVGMSLRSGNILVLVFLVFLMLLSSYMVVNVRLLTRVHFNVMDFKTKVKVYYSSAGNFDCYWMF